MRVVYSARSILKCYDKRTRERIVSVAIVYEAGSVRPSIWHFVRALFVYQFGLFFLANAKGFSPLFVARCILVRSVVSVR